VNGVLKFMGIKSGIFLSLALVFSCGKADEKPDNILSQQEMVKVLAEIYIAEEKVNSLALSRDSAAQVFDLVQERIFDTTGVPDSAFKRSIDYYTDRPLQMEKIYSALVDSLQLREQRSSSIRSPQ
jgi:hypothetical protein